MKILQCDYDIFPLVFPVGKETEITLRPLGVHAKFPNPAKIVVSQLNAGSASYAMSTWNHTDYENLVPAEDGCLHFKYTAAAEGEHAVRVFNDENKRLLQFDVYALEADLACRLPFRGDLHMHTCRSDGHEDPAIVCANYRKKGYDFIVITDHHRYYPSLEAMQKYAGAKIPLDILPGEEVHLPGIYTHIVNAGGLFSVNGLFPFKENYRETDGDLDKRRFDATVTPPDTLTAEQWEEELKAVEATITDCPEDVDIHVYARAVWIFNKIREAGGLGVFPHPYWRSDMYHDPEPLTRYMMKKHPFDAYEVLGGENYYEHNGLQTALYYDEYREGRVHPIVGSTDSHGSTENNRNSDICSTIVFAHKNERADLIASIKDHYSVAVDTISKEYRLVGEFRLQKYACFLMENWYPLHDREALLDGELMRQYYLGELDAETLSAFAPRAEKLFAKYFAQP